MTSAPADWYTDPSDPRQMRYWDGVIWTEHVAAIPSAGPTQPSDTAQPTQLVKPADTAQPSQASTPQHDARAYVEAILALEDDAEPLQIHEKVPLLGVRTFAKKKVAEVARLRAEMQRLGMLSIAELERKERELRNRANSTSNEPSNSLHVESSFSDEPTLCEMHLPQNQ